MNFINSSIRSPSTFRLLANLWPPFLAAGIRVDYVSPDWSRVETSLPLLIRNAGYMGTHFGGNIYSMADPFYVIMLIHMLGPEFAVWDRRSTVDYVKPGRGTLRATFEIVAMTADELRRETEGGGECLKDFEVNVRDEEDDVVAHVVKTVYVRRKRKSNGSSLVEMSRNEELSSKL